MARVFTGTAPASRLSLRLLLGAIVVPVLLGWLMTGGQRAGFYGQLAGLALLVAANVVQEGRLSLTVEEVELAGLVRDVGMQLSEQLARARTPFPRSVRRASSSASSARRRRAASPGWGWDSSS